MLRLLSISAAFAALLIAGCGDDDDSSDSASDEGTATTEAPAPATTTEEAASTGTEIKLGDSQFGQILFDADDQAIYLFDKEAGPTSECYGDCAVAWPPVLTKGGPQAGDGVKRGLLGTTKRDDGTTQVTYNGHPLYYYAHEGPGEVTCHNVDEFGGLWLVVDPAGDAV
jgi:predicted lipoprotein with Yx(FWY)xxD motif